MRFLYIELKVCSLATCDGRPYSTCNRSIELLSSCSGWPGLLCLAEERTAGRRHREGPGSPDGGPTPAALHAREEESVHSTRAFRLPIVLFVCLFWWFFNALHGWCVCPLAMFAVHSQRQEVLARRG